MKKIVDISGEGLESLLGEKVILLCTNYFYAGVLNGVNKTCVRLDGAHIVYETGKWSDDKWADAQLLGDAHYVRISHIESFRKGK